MKKIVCVLMVFATFLSLTACGNKTSGKTTSPTIVINGGMSTESAQLDMVETTTVTEPENDTSEEVLEEIDQLEGLVVTESEAIQLGGAYLLRGDKIYSLNFRAGGKGRTFDFAVTTILGNSGIYYSGDEVMTSYGDAPIPVLEESDRVVMYASSGDIPKLVLRQMEFKGYAIPVFQDDTYYFIYDPESPSWGALSKPRKREIHSFTVSDRDGNVLDDWTDLERGAEYVVSWFQGTQYSEMTLTANGKHYEVTSDERFQIDGVLTKNGYVEFDLSELPAGLYALPGGWLSQSGLLEIR